MPTPRRPLPREPLRLRATLKRSLSSAARVAVLGVGSDLRGDDAVGALVARRLQEAPGKARLQAFEGGSAPENLTGEIVRFLGEAPGASGHLVVVDAAELEARPGTVRLLTAKDIAGIVFSTHQLPLSMVISYLVERLGCGVTVVAVQPKALEFNTPVSPALARVAARIAEAIRESVR